MIEIPDENEIPEPRRVVEIPEEDEIPKSRHVAQMKY
jgi:hypothetical protein